MRLRRWGVRPKEEGNNRSRGIGVKDLTRRSFASKAAACLAALGAFKSLERTSQAQIVWKTTQWKLGSFEALLGEKARVKQLFDITQVEDGAALAKVKNSLNGLHYGVGVRWRRSGWSA